MNVVQTLYITAHLSCVPVRLYECSANIVHHRTALRCSSQMAECMNVAQTLYIIIHLSCVPVRMYECSANTVHQYVSQVSYLPVKMRECINVNGTLRCPRSPVCGSDGRTYGNECQLRSAGCTRQQEIHIVSMDNCDGQYLLSFLPSFLLSFFCRLCLSFCPFLTFHLFSSFSLLLASSLSFPLSFPHLSSFFFLSSPGSFILMSSFFLLSILHSFLPFLFSI